MNFPHILRNPLFLTTLFLQIPVTGSAQELALQPTGTPDHYIIRGNGFGLAPNIAIHDDFDDGTIGSQLNGWSLSSSHGVVPVYSNDKSITGTTSGKANFSGDNYNSSAEFKNIGGLRQVYLSYYVNVDRISGDASRNVKLARLTAGYSGGYLQPSAGTTLFDNYSNGYTYVGPGEGKDDISKWFGSYSDGNWHRLEHIVVLSTPYGAANGSARFYIDGQLIMDKSNLITDYYGNSFHWLTLPYYVAHSPGGDYNIYYDNVVLSELTSRIEICTQPTKDECTHPFLAKVISWNNSEIEFELRSTEGYENTDLYLYVYNDNNTLINNQGVLVSGSGECQLCPNPPQLNVNN